MEYCTFSSILEYIYCILYVVCRTFLSISVISGKYRPYTDACAYCLDHTEYANIHNIRYGYSIQLVEYTGMDPTLPPLPNSR
jgi:hypothetical protein